MIELTAGDGHKLSAYRAEPKGKPRGGLIVVQEIFGVNGHIRSIDDGYAADGYLAVAPAFSARAQRAVLHLSGGARLQLRPARLVPRGEREARARALARVSAQAHRVDLTAAEETQCHRSRSGT